MKIIGVTGPSGAGKGELCKLFEEKNIPCLGTDSLYHQLLIPPSACLDELVLTFGDVILNKDKTLNRKALANIVFSDKKLLNTLNNITHKYIIAKIKSLLNDLESKGFPYALVDAPLLFEAEFDKDCDITISVLADLEIRKARIMLRDNLTEADAEKRINAQQANEFYIEKSDFIIYNNKDKKELENSFLRILKSIGD